MSDIKSTGPAFQEHYAPVQQPQQAYQQEMSMNNTQAPMPQEQQQYGNEMKQVQGGVMMPQQHQPIQYQSATPLQSIGQGPTPVDCPACGTRAMTRVEYESGNTT
ncbi:hypothetical protein MMC34_004622 [Xylographa carneopallida]|nr:hypothetical protein [Xylographa carneopallida]